MSAPTAEQARLLDDAERLVREGDTGAAIAQLAALPDIPALQPRVEALIAECRRRRDGRLLRALPPAPGMPEFALRPARSRTSLVVFCPLGEGDGFVGFMQDQLGHLGMNAVYAFDRSNLYYFDGFGGGSIAAGVAKLRSHLDELGTRRIICLGLSSAGYGALRYGLELGADAVLALSPRIILAPRGRIVRRIEAALGRPLPPDEVDLAVQFRARARLPHTLIVFGADSPKDVAMCGHLAGIPGVTLHPLPGVSAHNSLHELSQAGAFAGLFAGFLREISPGPARRLRRALSGT